MSTGVLIWMFALNSVLFFSAGALYELKSRDRFDRRNR